MTSVAVINHAGITLHRVSVKHAVKMLWRQVVISVEEDASVKFGPYPRPIVVQLVRDVFAKWLYGPAAYNKSSLHKRDRHLCLYCGRRGSTVDHLLPQSRGGRDTWLNCVTACVDCNGRKGDRTPSEAGMRLRHQPTVPKRIDLLAT